MTDRPQGLWRLSLRELLVLVALLAAACVVLKFASPVVATLMAGLTLLVCGVMAVFAFLDRGSRQAFAIGFTVIAVGFTYVLKTYNNDGRDGTLPTQQLLLLLHRQVATQWMIDPSTGERVRRRQPSDTTTYPAVNPYAPTQPAPRYAPPYPQGVAPQPVFISAAGSLMASDYPSINDFLAVGNSLWTLLLAYLAGKLGAWVYGCRVAREGDNATPESGDA